MTIKDFTKKVHHQTVLGHILGWLGFYQPSQIYCQ